MRPSNSAGTSFARPAPESFERILENAPTNLSHAQLRVLLRALVNLAPYTFADYLADDIVGDTENEQRSAEEVLLSTIDATADDKLTRFAGIEKLSVQWVFANLRNCHSTSPVSTTLSPFS
jgi:hypothetical protein